MTDQTRAAVPDDARIGNMAIAMRDVDRLASDRRAHEGLHWYRQMAIAADRADRETAPGVEEALREEEWNLQHAKQSGRHIDALRHSSVVAALRALSRPADTDRARSGVEAAEAVCHAEQMTVWTGELAFRLSHEGYLRDDLDGDDVAGVQSVLADELSDIVKSAFTHPELDRASPDAEERIREDERDRLYEKACRHAAGKMPYAHDASVWLFREEDCMVSADRARQREGGR